MESKSKAYHALKEGTISSKRRDNSPTAKPADCGGCSHRAAWESANPCRSCGGGSEGEK